jgi:hypothetical protein
MTGRACSTQMFGRSKALLQTELVSCVSFLMFTSNIYCITILCFGPFWCFDDTLMDNGLAGIKWEDLLDMAFL